LLMTTLGAMAPFACAHRHIANTPRLGVVIWLNTAPMLHINDLTYRVEGRLLIDHATVALPEGHKVGFVGRNGTGKSTLLKLILGELQPETGSCSVPKNARIGTVAQEAPGGPETLIEVVLAADTERASLLAEAETASDPNRIAEIQTRLADIDAHAAPARAATILSGLGFNEAAQNEPCSAFSGGWRMRVALAATLFSRPDILLLDEPTNYLDLEGTVWLEMLPGRTPGTRAGDLSHDRACSTARSTQILHLDHRKLTLYGGAYDQFEAERREKRAAQLAAQAEEAGQGAAPTCRASWTASATRRQRPSRRSRRLKMLEKMEPIEVLARRRRLRLRLPLAARTRAAADAGRRRDARL
jgi:ATP-binding cassette subfamily F protein 3